MGAETMKPVNTYVDLDGRTYRVCRLRPGDPFVGMIALCSDKPRGTGGMERPIDNRGRRAREILKAERERGRPTRYVEEG